VKGPHYIIPVLLWPINQCRYIFINNIVSNKYFLTLNLDSMKQYKYKYKYKCYITNIKIKLFLLKHIKLLQNRETKIYRFKFSQYIRTNTNFRNLYDICSILSQFALFKIARESASRIKGLRIKSCRSNKHEGNHRGWYISIPAVPNYNHETTR